MLDFYFAIHFNQTEHEDYIHIAAPTAMCAWDLLDQLLKSLGWVDINYGKTRMIQMYNFQNSQGNFFKNI